MCGIAGLIDVSSRGDRPGLEGRARAMAESLRHRGPDQQGVWTDEAAGLAFSFRRLAIRDLSPAGHQPMVSASGRFVIAFNGEIYSQDAIQRDLEARGVVFRGHSDTEVMLESFAAFGVARTVERLIGMFAIALWDREEQTLVLIRDRLGIKPLYWGQFGGLFMFGSELKALRAVPGWPTEIDRDSAAAYLRHAYVPGPHTIYKGVKKLPPGAVLTLRRDAEPEVAPYWDARAVVGKAVRERFDLSDADAADRLEALLKDAVGRRLVSDVPLGAFLSGGIDSSTVVALMQAQSTRPIRTFTIGFGEEAYDEARHAKAVAAHLGTDHTELYVDPGHAQAVIPSLPDWYDEPFADVSQIPTYLVSEMTRRHVTVALSGDGGDELFAGYTRYAFAQNLWGHVGRIPMPLRRLAAGAIRGVPPGLWDALLAPLPRNLMSGRAGDRMHKLAGVMGESSGDSYYRALISQWKDPDVMVRGGRERRGILWDEGVAADVPNFVERMQFRDLVTYLPDDILAKVDRASMAVALEARVPLLDHRVVDFAFRLPLRQKLRNGRGKWLLRQVLYRHVPADLVERPKMGFGVPIDSWLRGPLRDWAESLLAERRLADGGIVDPAPVRALWADHLAGRRNAQYPIWVVLMLEAWRERWMQSDAAPAEHPGAGARYATLS